MSREIKFRAWSPRVTKQGDKFIGAFTDVHAILKEGRLISTDFIDDYIVFQEYTGLKDMNGNEIYEGDITQWNGDQETGTFEVKFLSGHFSAGGPLHLSWSIDHVTLQVNNLEIIGNVYENPELMEEKND